MELSDSTKKAAANLACTADDRGPKAQNLRGMHCVPKKGLMRTRDRLRCSMLEMQQRLPFQTQCPCTTDDRCGWTSRTFYTNDDLPKYSAPAPIEDPVPTNSPPPVPTLPSRNGDTMMIVYSVVGVTLLIGVGIAVVLSIHAKKKTPRPL